MRLPEPRIPFKDGVGGESTRGIHRLIATTQPRYYRLKYAGGLSPKASRAAPDKGSTVHLAIAYKYGFKLPTEEQPGWLHEMSLEERWALEPTYYRDEYVRIARSYMRFYDLRTEGEPWEPACPPEREFFLRLDQMPEIAAEATRLGVGDEVVSGRLDLPVFTNGVIWPVDHKSTSWTRGDSLGNFNTDSPEYALPLQMMFQIRLLRAAYGEELVGRPIIQRLKIKEPYDMDRNVLIVPPHAYAKSAYTILQRVLAERELKRKIAAREPIEDCYWACQGRYGACDFLPICKTTPEHVPDVIQLEFNQE